MKKKILLLSLQNVYEDANGVSRFILDVHEGLNARGHDVSIVTPHIARENLLFRFLRQLGHPKNYFFFYLRSQQKKILREIKARGNKNNIIIANDVLSAQTALKFSRNVFLVTHFHTFPWEEFADAGWIEKGSLSYTWLKKEMLQTLSNPNLQFIFVSKSNRNSILDYLPENKRVKTII